MAPACVNDILGQPVKSGGVSGAALVDPTSPLRLKA
jgi:hypothetical protein